MVGSSLLFHASCSDNFAEIDPEVDFDSRRAVYFRQMRYGLFVCSLSLSFNTVN
jgi:aspartate carbamoyltransferase catalytic subunit